MQDDLPLALWQDWSGKILLGSSWSAVDAWPATHYVYDQSMHATHEDGEDLQLVESSFPWLGVVWHFESACDVG